MVCSTDHPAWWGVVHHTGVWVWVWVWVGVGGRGHDCQGMQGMECSGTLCEGGGWVVMVVVVCVLCVRDSRRKGGTCLAQCLRVLRTPVRLC
jgi:hypothetical protein